MKEDFQSYPEIIFIDATYKLTELHYPVYIFLVEDSMGESEIAGIGLLVSENAESLRWLLNAVIMADKDLNERHILKECFPTASVLICLFHNLRSFKRTLGQKVQFKRESKYHTKRAFSKTVRRRKCKGISKYF